MKQYATTDLAITISPILFLGLLIGNLNRFEPKIRLWETSKRKEPKHRCIKHAIRIQQPEHRLLIHILKHRPNLHQTTHNSSITIINKQTNKHIIQQTERSLQQQWQ
ncbi:hypothetical protein HanXRQr2_Chr16g0777731 [Helianthus annuus]|uniref:Uncharacterized protein n=1 Tax=Helianthus annuus TaxID=4232 RepID=A0A9K3DXT2_HELAN|nr:hypothetical protein HanXRQr2_Chr16g0777731 [Helianthus annuus]